LEIAHAKVSDTSERIIYERWLLPLSNIFCQSIFRITKMIEITVLDMSQNILQNPLRMRDRASFGERRDT